MLGAPFFGAPNTGILGRGTKKEVASRRDARNSAGPCAGDFQHLSKMYVAFTIQFARCSEAVRDSEKKTDASGY